MCSILEQAKGIADAEPDEEKLGRNQFYLDMTKRLQLLGYESYNNLQTNKKKFSTKKLVTEEALCSF